MAYDPELYERMRRSLEGVDGVEERRMFGGVAFLVNGNMACGVANSQMMVRVGADAYERTLAERHVAPMTFTGKPLAGFVYVEPAGLSRPEQVARWTARGVDYARTLPAKGPKTNRAGGRTGETPKKLTANEKRSTKRSASR